MNFIMVSLYLYITNTMPFEGGNDKRDHNDDIKLTSIK